jgi:heme-degrading monooxygenase HmoA
VHEFTRETEGRIVSVMLLSVAPDESERLVGEATALMQRKTELEGFIEGEIFQSDDRERVLIVTEWRSKHDWSRSQWDAEVGHAVVAITQTASAVDARTYFRTARVQADFRSQLRVQG